MNADDTLGWALLRIDPLTNSVAERIPVGVPGWGLSIVGDTAWMTSWERSRVLRINLASGEIEAEITTLAEPLGIAAAEDGVWVALGGQGTMARIDPSTNEYSLIDIGTETTTVPAIIGDEIWVTTLYSGQVVVVSRQTDEVVERIVAQAPMGLAQDEGLAWVTDSYADLDGVRHDSRVIGIDLASREIVRALPLGGLEVDRGIAVDGSTLWVVTTDGVARLDI